MWQGQFDKLFIGGEWTTSDSDSRISVISPFTEQPIGAVPDGTRNDIDRAVGAARRAFDEGPWPRMSLEERKQVVQRLSEQFSRHEETLANLVSNEMGCPITLSRSMQAIGPRLLIDNYLELVDQYPFRSVRRASTGNALVERVPVGVVAAIVPWNAPQLVTMIKLAPALLAGCSVVLKPAPETPFDAYLLAEMAQAAGLPDGVLNVVPAGREVSEYLVSHADVDKVTFTGSTAAGRRIGSICGQDLRRVSLELGGKSAAIILDDADLDAAVEALRLGSFRNTGQVCSLKTRVIVSKRREQELLERLVGLVGSMPVGDPLDPNTQLGPLVSARQRQRVEEYIAIGKSEGARIVTGGGRPAGLDTGWFVEPTIFAGVDAKMRIAQEEIFGPVLSVIACDSEAEAIAIANDSDYGLNGSVFAGDIEHGLAVARQVKTGTVELNGCGVGFQAPIGGVKASGIGREAGLEGFDPYVELKSFGIPRDVADRLAESI